MYCLATMNSATDRQKDRTIIVPMDDHTACSTVS